MPRDSRNSREFDEFIRERLEHWKNKSKNPLVESKFDKLFPPQFFEDVEASILAFPTTLDGKARRVIHQRSFELNLYHYSTGEGSDRQIIVCREEDQMLEAEKEATFSNKQAFFLFDPAVSKPSPNTMPRPFHNVSTALDYIQTLKVQTGKLLASTKVEDLQKGISVLAPLASSSIAFLPNPFLPTTSVEGGEVEEKKEEDPFCVTLPSGMQHRVTVELIEDEAGVIRVAEILSDCSDFAFDLESHSYRSYFGFTCALQISCEVDIFEGYPEGGDKEDGRKASRRKIGVCQKNFLIDTLRCWTSMHHLKPVFESPDIVKTAHAIQGVDAPAMQRDFGIVLDNVFDTQVAFARLAPGKGNKTVGLLKLVSFFGIPEHVMEQLQELKSTYQMCDWRKRPFSQDMMHYAMNDVYYLLHISRILRRCALENVEFATGALLEPIVWRLETETSSQGGKEGRGEGEDEDEDDDEDEWEGWGEFGNSSSSSSSSSVVNIPLCQEGVNKYHEILGKARSTVKKGWVISKKLRDPLSHVKHHHRRPEFHLGLLKRVFLWREKIACAYDESPDYVLKADFCELIAMHKPTSLQTLKHLFVPPSHFFETHPDYAHLSFQEASTKEGSGEEEQKQAEEAVWTSFEEEEKQVKKQVQGSFVLASFHPSCSLDEVEAVQSSTVDLDAEYPSSSVHYLLQSLFKLVAEFNKQEEAFERQTLALLPSPSSSGSFYRLLTMNLFLLGLFFLRKWLRR